MTAFISLGVIGLFKLSPDLPLISVCVTYPENCPFLLHFIIFFSVQVFVLWPNDYLSMVSVVMSPFYF